jgi:hypothetical protein
MRMAVLTVTKGDQDEDHLAAIVFGAQALMHYRAMIDRGVLQAELNDMRAYDAPAAT